MNYFFTLFLFIIYTCVSYSQTGPAGIGDTTGTSSLILWLDANSINGLSDGDPVSTWLDQSGYGHNASTADDYTCENAPEYRAGSSGQNNVPSVYFDADNYEALELEYNGTLTPTQNLSIFSVYQPAADDGNDISYGAILMQEDDDKWKDGYCFGCRNDQTGDYIFYTNEWDEGIQPWGGAGDFSTGLTNGTHYILGITREYATGDLFYWQNDGEATDSNTTQAANNTNISYNSSDDITIAGYTTDPCGDDYLLEGYIPEIIMYNVALNNAQAVILNNYLAAKYGLTLTNLDIYTGDDNGYDFEVAGIGQHTDGSNHTDAQGTGIVRILNPTNLDINEYMIWGHDNGAQQAIETTDVPATVEARLERVWSVSEVDSSGSGVNVGKVDMRWDLSGMGSVTASDLRLLIDTDRDGNFNDESPISGASDLGGDIYQFSSIVGGVAGIRNNVKFTLGTINQTQTPLPIELTYFNALNSNENKVLLEWQTASEKNNDFFTVERSNNGKDWEAIIVVYGKGNSNTKQNYNAFDISPLNGTNYYRLKQTDFDGTFTYSPIKYVTINKWKKSTVSIYPNPTINSFTLSGNPYELHEINIIDVLGSDVSKHIEIEKQSESKIYMDVSKLKPGFYFIKTKTSTYKVYKK